MTVKAFDLSALYTRDTFFPSEEGRQDELDCIATMYIL